MVSTAFLFRKRKTASQPWQAIAQRFCSINIARIESRVAAGGHNVDSGKVIERYYKSINNIKELLDICDIMHVYDNTKSPERIIRKHKEELSIYPNEYWSEQDILGLME